MRKRTTARECALQILYQSEITQDTLLDVLADFWEHNESDPQVQTFAQQLVQGVVEHREELDALISRVADNWELERMAVIDRNVLRLASFELMFVQDIPPKVSINEGIELAKKFGDMDSGKFVNGILDRIAQSKLQADSSEDQST